MKVVSDTQSSNKIVDIIKQLIIYLFLFWLHYSKRARTFWIANHRHDKLKMVLTQSSSWYESQDLSAFGHTHTHKITQEKKEKMF